MQNNTCVVVIPVHSPHPSTNELISFRQCFRILFRHPIKIIAPEGLDLSAYRKETTGFDVIYIDKKWQSSLLMYNKLKLSLFFYGLFKNFDYMLTYELDAFVFSDDLDYWCSKGYDYIGAPWFESFHLATGSSKMIGVGNSGFSLRKIATLAKLLKLIYYQGPWQNGRKRTRQLAYLFYPFAWLVSRIYKDNIIIQKIYRGYEDNFICHYLAESYPEFILAPVEDAMYFSFESNAEKLYSETKSLPFGCHAWWRYQFDFWRPKIESCGYSFAQPEYLASEVA